MFNRVSTGNRVCTNAKERKGAHLTPKRDSKADGSSDHRQGWPQHFQCPGKEVMKDILWKVTLRRPICSRPSPFLSLGPVGLVAVAIWGGEHSSLAGIRETAVPETILVNQ